MKVFCLDTETSAGSRDGKVVQFAIVDETYKGEWLINPMKHINPGCIAVHKITQEMVQNKPSFFMSEGYTELRKRLDDGEIMIAHHAPFDVSILANEGVHITQYIDTCKVARKILKSDGVPKFGLQFLKEYLHLEALNPKDTLTGYAHSALYDTIVLHWLYKYLFKKIQKQYIGEDPHEIMLEITSNVKPIKRFHFGKYKGEKIASIAQKDLSYLQWLYESEMTVTKVKRKNSLIQGLAPYISC